MDKKHIENNKEKKDSYSLPGKENSENVKNTQGSTKKASENLQTGQKNGLYAALGVCLVSVAAAAIVTYVGFTDISDSSELYKAGTNVIESTVSEKDSDDPMKDMNRNNLKNEVKEEDVKEKSESILENHEGDGEKTSKPEKEVKEETSKGTTVEKSEEKAEEHSIIKETSAEAYTVSPQFSRIAEGHDIKNGYSANLIYNEVMKDYRTHNGIDIIASKGENVYAAANGKVKGIYKDILLGNVAEIEHGEYIFYYCGLDEITLIKAGDIVTAGNIIGKVGDIPFEITDSGHIHLEVKKDGMYKDPTELIK